MFRHTKSAVYSLFVSLLMTFVHCQKHESPETIEKDLKWALGAKMSTSGLGIEIKYLLSNKIHLRAALSYINYNYPIDNLRDDLGGYIHYSPFGTQISFEYQLYKNIYSSLGTVFNFSKISISGMLAEPVFVGDIEMTPKDVGQISAVIKPENLISPYLGLGVGNVFKQTNRVLYSIDLGVLFHGKPEVSLTADGMLTPTASKEQETLIENNIAPLTFLPILSFSIYYLL